MNRRGIALLATLWLLAALSVVAATTMTIARVERGAAMNRVTLARARWAANACLAIADGERGEAAVPRNVDSTPLGADLWCRATMEDLGASVALDTSNADLLARLVADPDRSAALLDWLDADDVARASGAEVEWYRGEGRPLPRNGPMASVDELYRVRGFDSATIGRLHALVRVGPSRPIDPNVASRALLLVLPGLEPSAVDLLVAQRDRGVRWSDLDGMLATLPANLRVPAMARYAELQAKTAFAPGTVIVRLEGHVLGTRIVARPTVLAVLAPFRLAIVAREEW